MSGRRRRGGSRGNSALRWWTPSNCGSHEAIPDGGFVDDQLGLRGVAFQFLPKRPHGYPQIVDMLLLGRAPDRSQQVSVTQDATGMLGEFGQYGVFLRRQV